MQVVRLAHETDFDGWRAAARRLRAHGVAPEAALWTVGGQGDGEPAEAAALDAFTVPKGFLDLANRLILHRSDERFSLLYRLLWRLQDDPRLLRMVADPDVARARDFADAVSRAAHQMKAFVRLRPAADAQGPALVGWFEPAHRVAAATAPFFALRHPDMRFSILTPDVCVHWDRRELAFTPGADPADAPRQDALEDYWRTHHAAVFRNPARSTPIPPPMPRPAAPDPGRREVKAALRASRDAPYDGQAPTSLAEVAAGVGHCRRCDLWRDAVQGVTGEGPAPARLLFVGEQPGDQEDLAGRPFVGPAGQVFDEALAAAGVPRAETYVTNAVKHFKHELSGKRRIHRTPDAGEVAACRWWLDAERRLIRPRVIVALGGTAALAVFGKPTPVGRFRQQALQLSDQAQGVVTYHPAYLLRVPDAAAKAKAYAMFVEDLTFAWGLAARS
jgi:DNA polymerase